MFYDTSHLGPIGYSVQRPTPLPPTHPKLKNGRHLVKMDPLARDMAGSASTLQLQHARASGLEALSPPVLKKAADARPFPSTASAAPGEDRGINRFYPTLAETMNKMQSGALESKWERLSRWLECYSEEDAVLDAAAACEQLCGTLQETADAVPGKRNTAMSCVMLDKLLFILSKLQPKLLPAIGQTRNGLLHSIFPSFADEPDDQVRESAPTDPGALEATLEKYAFGTKHRGLLGFSRGCKAPAPGGYRTRASGSPSCPPPPPGPSLRHPSLSCPSGQRRAQSGGEGAFPPPHSHAQHGSIYVWYSPMTHCRTAPCAAMIDEHISKWNPLV